MAKAKQSIVKYGSAFLICLLTLCAGGAYADATYSGGVTVDINEEILGYVLIEDATVNLLENAWIAADPVTLYPGDIYSTSGSVLNIYGGKIDGALYISTYYNNFPEANVTVYGSDFAVNGVPVEAGTTELFLQNKTLSGVYENGTPFAFNVQCFWEGDFYLTVNLGWIEGTPEIFVEPTAIDFGQVEVGSTSEPLLVTIRNNGNTSLNLQNLNIVQAVDSGFSYTPLPQMPLTMEPDSVVTVEVQFTPSAEGAAVAILQIASDDPENPQIDVALSGTGFVTALTAKQQIAAIIDFYRACLIDGTIYGVGPGRSAANKAKALEHMLISAQKLIECDYDEVALIPLYTVKFKTDAVNRPCDFVEGPSVPILNAMVSDLIVYIEN